MERTNNKLNPRMASTPGVLTQATLVGGECSHHYTNLTPPRGETSCGFAEYRLFSQAF